LGNENHHVVDILSFGRSLTFGMDAMAEPNTFAMATLMKEDAT
jgi:hypothetical protein